MNPAIYIAIFLPLFVIMMQERKRTSVVLNTITKMKKETAAMKELAQGFIGKDCLVYTITGAQIGGVIKEISGNAVLLDNNNSIEAVNLDFIVRIREYPTNKNGKRKAFITD